MGGVARWDPTHVIPEVSCVCLLCFKSVPQRVCLDEVPFLSFFGPDMNTKMGVVIYMYKNIPQIILIPNIYGFMGQTPLIKVFF